MTTAAIREKLHTYIDAITEEKLKAIYTVVETDIEQVALQYSEAFRNELDRRYQAYLDGEKTYTMEEMKERIEQIRQEYKARQK